MHAVIVDGDVSYPPTSGKRLRTLHLMLKVAQRHRVTYVARGDARSQDFAAAEGYLRQHGIEPVLVDDPVAKKSGLLFYARLAANVLSSWPYSVASHQSRKMQEALARTAAKGHVDVWQIEWSGYVPMLPPDARPRVLIGHNVDTLIWQRYYENARGFLKRWYLKGQWRKFDAFERWALQEADYAVAVSTEDAALMRDRFGQRNVAVVDNGIDRTFFAGVEGKRDPRRVLFLGALDWRPNLDGVDLLLTDIFPAVVAQEPSARLVIVGRQPPPGLIERVTRLPWAELHANVPDVRPYLAECGVMAVPLRIGGGSRLKILEALACALPVVSTRVGAEGLLIEPGVHYRQADEHGMAAALVEVMRAPDTAQAEARQGQAFVLSHYDWDILARKLEEVWRRVAVRGDKVPAGSSRG